MARGPCAPSLRASAASLRGKLQHERSREILLCILRIALQIVSKPGGFKLNKMFVQRRLIGHCVHIIYSSFFLWPYAMSVRGHWWPVQELPRTDTVCGTKPQQVRLLRRLVWWHWKWLDRLFLCQAPWSHPVGRRAQSERLPPGLACQGLRREQSQSFVPNSLQPEHLRHSMFKWWIYTT